MIKENNNIFLLKILIWTYWSLVYEMLFHKQMTPNYILLAKSEDPDEILHNVAFHLDLHSMLRQK